MILIYPLSALRATLLAELALKRQFGKDSRRGKQENRGRRATLLTGIAFKRQRDKDSRYRRFLSRFSPLREKAKIGCPPHQSTPLTASPQGEALTKARITLFAEKMKFAEFFSGKGEAFERGKIKPILYRLLTQTLSPKGKARVIARLKSLCF